ncbi:MAG: phosphotransferase [Clostridiales bacterium]|nr:phosphotransferase [Clostridiales bacterium]
MSGNFEELFGPVVGKGLQATVYARGDYAVKLYREGYDKTHVFEEALIMARLEEMDFPGPKVYEVLLADGQYGLRMDRVRGSLMNEGLNDPERRLETMKTLVGLQLDLQKHSAPWALDFRQRLQKSLEDNKVLAPDLREQLLAEIRDLPDGQTMCHCDFHGGNVFFDGEKHMIIDLLQISAGDPAADAACSYVSYSFAHKGTADLYLDIYCEQSGIPKERVARWLRVYAGALTGEVPETHRPLLEKYIMGEEGL